MLKLCHNIKPSKSFQIAWQLPMRVLPIRWFSGGLGPRLDSPESDLNAASQKLIDQYLESILFSGKSPSDEAPQQSNVEEEEKKEDLEAKNKTEDEEDKDEKDKDKNDEDDEDEDDDDHDHKGSILIPLLNLLKI
jgi:hypothetical protein